MPVNKPPEQLRQEYLAAQVRIEVGCVHRSKRLYFKWMAVGGIFASLCGVVNYLDIVPIILLHVCFSAAVCALLIRFKRGPWTGILVYGVGNEVISLLAGTVNLLGFLLFIPAGGLIGMAMYIERQP